ncbi:MAG: SPFH domain-containing protein [Novosphingobium sp.]
MSQLLRDYRHPLFALLFVALLGIASLTVVREDEQVVIERMGEPVRMVNRFRPQGPSGAGLVAHVPLLEQVISLPRGLVAYGYETKRVRSADLHTLLVDTDVTYRIIDPVRLVNTLGSTAKVDDQLKALLPPLLDQELAQRIAADIVRPGAGGANASLLRGLDARTRQYGVQVIDVRLARTALDEDGRNVAFNRMQERLADALLDIEMKSAADALAVTGAAEAEATTRRKQSSDKDPEFYSFFRAMRSYDELYGDPKRKNSTTIVLPPDSGYLKYFGGK